MSAALLKSLLGDFNNFNRQLAEKFIASQKCKQ